jgi:hypothetical protein
VSDHDWQAPGAAPAHGPGADAAAPTPTGVPTPPPLPPSGEPQQRGYAAPPPSYAPPPAYGPPPGYDAPPAGYAAPPAGGWAPPPKPGLLPLRPMGFGTLMWAPFRTLRRNPAPTFGSGLVVQLVSVAATAAVLVPFFGLTFSRLEEATGADADAILSGAVGGFLLLSLVPVLLSIVASAFLQGVMVVDVATGTVGDRLGFGALWRRAGTRIWPLIGWTLMVAAALLVAFGVVVGVVVLAAVSTTSPVGLVIGIVVGLLLGLGLLVAGFWIGVKLAVVPSIIVLEQVGIRAAVARSWRLTDGAYWRTFGVLALVGVILNVAAQVVVQPVSIIGTILAVLIDPTGTGAAVVVTVVTTIVTLVLSLLIGAITAVVQAALVAVIYIDLRMRREGLDLELQRYVELREAGQPADDPYRTQVGSVPRGSEPPAGWS